ncbi:type II toxin-antitoxin system RelE/ParE family toxin [Xanthomonas sp. XNM01]|uniref:type II toxin-antitoxin system RelE/ParE family toxin n=1 Tax=Xanthomonas sp. XNM01 TaxID=2769289 RepID=UPI0017867331|nr:type II toxin-antitoxin system RelE/ParE family toxin [Xanthomonas sp. XNM01]MBD9370392.1 type II toxin-antitoxin system RelE/ParE family toxin [Xanthomonas sp. XNM01]
MSEASTRAQTGTTPRIDRLQPWLAALLSALLHVLMVLLLQWASPPVVSSPEGAAGGGARMRVDFVGETSQPELQTTAPPSPRPSEAPRPVRPRPTAAPTRSTLVLQAENPVPPEAPPAPVEPPSVQEPEPSPPERTAASSPPPTVEPQRHPERWTGRPPGLIEEDTAPENAGLSRSPMVSRGNRNDMAGTDGSMEIGGYQVYYDLRGENQVREWMAGGMTELSLPLPGTEYYMVCPLQVALERGSSKCRLLHPSSPEMKAIGDAREVITIVSVYKQGQQVWRGPGPYR